MGNCFRAAAVWQLTTIAGACCLLFPAATGVANARDTAAGMKAAVDAAIAKVRPALVRIQVVSTEYREGRELKMQTVGSGAIITKDGFLVTNHHVAGHGARMFCTLWNREELEAELIGTDPLTDIAVLKLKTRKPRTFACAAFGDSSKISVGESVLAMGSPMALSQSVTLGIISNTEMMMPRLFGPGGRFRLDGEDVGSLVRWIGHDAAIYGGNSGGPLVNLRGEIVGINEISYGLSGAIPGNLARRVAEELMASGRVRRSWLGLDVQPLFKHADGSRGVLISGVVADSPAARAGLAAGDLLVELERTPVNVRYDEQMPDFMRLVTSLPIGKEVPARIVRAGKEIAVRLVPAERGEFSPKQQELKPWGLTAGNLTFLLAKEMKRTNQNGVLVTSVRPGGPAGEAQPALEPRDLITRVNDQAINNLQDLLEVTRRLTDSRKEPVPVLATFEREARQYLTVVKVGLEELRDPGLEVSKAWLPAETHVISRDIARQLGQPNLKGFYLTEVYPNTTAEKAGLKPGDFILAVDNEKLTASGPEHEEELPALIRQYDIGATVQLTVLRGGQQLKIPVELARSPKLKREMKKYANTDFDFTARDICFFDQAEEQWQPGQRGALVEDVKPGSWAELGGLNVDDLVVQADGEPVENVDQLKTVLERVTREKKAVVILKVLRGIHTTFLEVEPAWKS